MSYLSVDNLTKSYQNETTAIENLSFKSDEGTIIGLVGPNGAGKTTTLKMLAGLLEPTSGTITINGHSHEDSTNEIGYIPEQSPIDESMTGIQYLQFFSNLYNIPQEQADERITQTLDELNLDDGDKKLGSMSKGMKRKIIITRALLHDPSIIIADEPASGLDPYTTNYINNYLQSLADDGKIIILSAHNLHHIEEIADTVLILSNGKKVAEGNPKELLENDESLESYFLSTVTEGDT